MIAPKKLYVKSWPNARWILFDLHAPEACKALHRLRAKFQDSLDWEPLGPDFLPLYMSPSSTGDLPQ